MRFGRKFAQNYRAFLAREKLSKFNILSILRTRHKPHLLQDGFYGTPPLSDDALAQKDRFCQTCRHDLVPIDQREEEPKVLLRAAEVVAEGCAPLLAVRLESVLKMRLLERLFD